MKAITTAALLLAAGMASAYEPDAMILEGPCVEETRKFRSENIRIIEYRHVNQCLRTRRSYLTVWPRTNRLPVVSKRWQGDSALDRAHEAGLDRIISDYGQSVLTDFTRDNTQQITWRRDGSVQASSTGKYWRTKNLVTGCYFDSRNRDSFLATWDTATEVTRQAAKDVFNDYEVSGSTEDIMSWTDGRPMRIPDGDNLDTLLITRSPGGKPAKHSHLLRYALTDACYSYQWNHNEYRENGELSDYGKLFEWLNASPDRAAYRGDYDGFRNNVFRGWMRRAHVKRMDNGDLKILYGYSNGAGDSEVAFWDEEGVHTFSAGEADELGRRLVIATDRVVPYHCGDLSMDTLHHVSIGRTDTWGGPIWRHKVKVEKCAGFQERIHYLDTRNDRVTKFDVALHQGIDAKFARGSACEGRGGWEATYLYPAGGDRIHVVHRCFGKRHDGHFAREERTLSEADSLYLIDRLAEAVEE